MKMHQQMFYFDTNKTRPTEADTQWDGHVLAFHNGRWVAVHWLSLKLIDNKLFDDAAAEEYPYWMQMPKAPSDADRDA
jgi:hypothetical protein